MGSVRLRGRRSFLLDYYGANGERHRETVRAASRAEAELLLKQREGDLAYGRPLFHDSRRITYKEIQNLFIEDYVRNQRRSIGKARKSAERLAEVFGGWRVINITASAVHAYIERRRADGYANASINLELS